MKKYFLGWLLATSIAGVCYAGDGETELSPMKVVEVDTLNIPESSRKDVFLEFEKAPNTTQSIKKTLSSYGYQFVGSKDKAKTIILIRGYVHMRDADRESPHMDLGEVVDKQINPNSQIAFAKTNFKGPETSMSKDMTMLSDRNGNTSGAYVAGGVAAGWIADKTGIRDAINGSFYNGIARLKSMCWTDCDERRKLTQELVLIVNYSDSTIQDHVYDVKADVVTKRDPVIPKMADIAMSTMIARMSTLPGAK